MLKPNKSSISLAWRHKAIFLPVASFLIVFSSFFHSKANLSSPESDPEGTTQGFSVNLVIAGMSEETEEGGTVIRVNADFNEKNRNAEGNPLADYQPDEKKGHRIVADDPNLMDGALFIEEPGKGKWRLIFPENIKIWRKEEGSGYQELDTSWFSDKMKLPFSCELKVEGIRGSQSANDVRILAEFTPAESKKTYRDSAFLTVLETQFALTFDDGPLREKTEKIIGALKNFYHNGEPVRAAFFQRTPKIHQFPELTRLVDENGHLVFCRALELERRVRKRLRAEEIEQIILLWEEEIYKALGRKPERMIRARYLKKGERFEKEAAKIGARICGGELVFDFRTSSPTKVKGKATKILEGWNTRENPQLHPYPAILIFHEFPKVTYDHIEGIISYLQDRGFVLVNFDPDLIY
ncbi:MAG: polysaccharide deacetylase family protein [Candidatus Zixiibacteriota bacterium]